MITRVDYVVKNIIVPIAEDKSNLCDFFHADTIGGRSFVLNDGGYPLNDIDLIMRQQDLAVAESLLRSLNEVPTSCVPVDTPPEEVLLSLRSRYQQTPSEMVSYYERQLELSQLKQHDNVPDKDKINFKSPDDVVDDN